MQAIGASTSGRAAAAAGGITRTTPLMPATATTPAAAAQPQQRRLCSSSNSPQQQAAGRPTQRRRPRCLAPPPPRALPTSGNGGGGNEALDDAVAPPPSSSSAPSDRPRPNLPPGVTALQPGARVGPAGRYTVLEVLGAGANAVAYRAADGGGEEQGGTGEKKEVALKALSLKSLRDWKQLDLFRREAETLRALSHPSIPALVDYFEEDTPDDRAFYIVQQAVPRGCATLAEMVAMASSAPSSSSSSSSAAAAVIGRPTDAEVLRIARDLLGVLDYLSSLRPPVVHRDIKPENIVVEGGRWGGKVYLVDFGGSVAAAAAASSSSSSSSSHSSVEVVSGAPRGAVPPPLGSTIVGTYGYMAPEQFRGEASPASDLYALGATLLFLATGRAPSSFPQDGRMRVDLSGAAARSLGPEVAELLDGLLEPLPEDRMTAAEALRVARGGGGGGRRRAQQQQQRPSSSSSSRGNGAALADADDDRMMVRLPDGSLLPVTAVRRGGNAAASSSPLARGARKPAGTRVRLEKTPGRLDIEIPPEGLGGQSLGTGLFALAWNGFVAFWTFSALASGGVLFALFSAPFWFAGAQLAQQALGGAFSRERLALGRRRFRLAQELATADKGGAAKFLSSAAGGGAGGREVEGDLEDLVGARIVTTVVVNGVPRTAVELVEGVRRHRFAEALEPAEQRWIVAEVDAFLEARRGRMIEERDFSAAEPAEVLVEDDDYLDGGMGPRGTFFGGRGADDAFTVGGARDDPFLDREDRFWGDRR